MDNPNAAKLIDQFISVVLITEPQTKKLDHEVRALSDTLSSAYMNYEIIVIENGISLGESTKLGDLLETLPCIRVIRLSRGHSKDICAFAGLESAIGDIVIIKSISDPVKLIKKFADQAQTYDLVFGVSSVRTRAGIVNQYGAKLFYWYNQHFMGISIPEQNTYYMALTRRAVNAITRSRQHARHIRYMARQVGYKSVEVSYKPHQVIQEKKQLRELIISALELTTNYSKSPLRFVVWIGFAGSIFNLIYVIYVLVIKLFVKNVAAGWTTLSLQSSIMFFFLFAILAILCEYIGQILQESRQEVPYHVADELNSKVSIADSTRRNIIY